MSPSRTSKTRGGGQKRSPPDVVELTAEQLQAVIEAMDLALAGNLHKCTCAAEDLPMPCEHVLEAAADKSLHFIRAAETESGASGWHNIAAAIEELMARFVVYREKRSRNATSAEPGSPEKLLILRERIRQHEASYRDGDNYHHPAPCVGGSSRRHKGGKYDSDP